MDRAKFCYFSLYYSLQSNNLTNARKKKLAFAQLIQSVFHSQLVCMYACLSVYVLRAQLACVWRSFGLAQTLSTVICIVFGLNADVILMYMYMC